MSLPLLLLVDDSEAVLAFEQAALSGRYSFCTAHNGKEALQKLGKVRPAAILLDLSMPEMGGMEFLARVRQDPELGTVPVLVVTSEKARQEECLRAGASGFLQKPLRSGELLSTVEKVLAVRVAKESYRTALFVKIGPLEIGLPLEQVRMVVHQPATLPLPGLSTSCASEYFDLYGQPVGIIDLARRLGVTHAASLVDRKLVVIELDESIGATATTEEVSPTVPADSPRARKPTAVSGSDSHGQQSTAQGYSSSSQAGSGQEQATFASEQGYSPNPLVPRDAASERLPLVALCVDEVRDPEEIPSSDITPGSRLLGERGQQVDWLIGMARTSRGQLPMLEPRALLSRGLIRRVRETIGSVAVKPQDGGGESL
ncbi:MAG: response regulator [Pseudomonadota bacterium]